MLEGFCSYSWSHRLVVLGYTDVVITDESGLFRGCQVQSKELCVLTSIFKYTQRTLPTFTWFPWEAEVPFSTLLNLFWVFGLCTDAAMWRGGKVDFGFKSFSFWCWIQPLCQDSISTVLLQTPNPQYQSCAVFKPGIPLLYLLVPELPMSNLCVPERRDCWLAWKLWWGSSCSRSPSAKMLWDFNVGCCHGPAPPMFALSFPSFLTDVTEISPLL